VVDIILIRGINISSIFQLYIDYEIVILYGVLAMNISCVSPDDLECVEVIAA